jgi:hypothetical protein
MKLRIAGFNISRSGASKIEAHLSYLDDKNTFVLRGVFAASPKKHQSRRRLECLNLLDP